MSIKKVYRPPTIAKKRIYTFLTPIQSFVGWKLVNYLLIEKTFVENIFLPSNKCIFLIILPTLSRTLPSLSHLAQ